MGAVFFFMLLAALFGVAIFFIILSVVFLIIRRAKKKKGKLVKKRWFVIPVAILIFNIIVALIPVGYIAFLRYENMRNATEIVYAESGKMLNWPMGEFESSTNWFEMDGIEYVQFREGFSGDPFYLCSTKDKRDNPVANIRHNPEDDNAFNKTMFLLLAGKTRDKLFVSTIYPLINENGFEFFEVNGSAGNDVYCPEPKLDMIKAYYADISNYDTQNLTCEYSVYSDKEGNGERRDTPYIHINKEVTLKPSVFIELYQTLDSEQGIKHVEIPQKYIELDEAAQPGTPIFGYDERQLFAYSKDKMAEREMRLVLLDGQVYIEQVSGFNYIEGYPLSEEMNKYIIGTVFND